MVTKLFSPKYKQFFKLFEDSSILLDSLGQKLNLLIEANNKEEATQTNEQIKKLFDQVDEITTETLRELQENFITPFDREDIVDLVTAIRGMAGHINTSARRMLMYSMFPSEKLTKEFGEIIQKGCGDVNRAMHLLRKGKTNEEMKQIVKMLYKYEDTSDDLYNKGIQKVLEDDNDFKTFFKEKDIYQKMELITDELENIGNVLEAIMIKYA